MKKSLLLLTIFLSLFGSSGVFAATGCQTGAEALGNAYVRDNPIYALYYGDLESYIASNQEHFVAGGDSIRCAQALSAALLNQAIKDYDPVDRQRKEELDAELRRNGIEPGPHQQTVGEQLFGIGIQLDRFARVLPSAAAGNFEPLHTPANELEELQAFSKQIIIMLMQDREMAALFNQLEPLITEAAQLDFKILLTLAFNLR